MIQYVSRSKQLNAAIERAFVQDARIISLGAFLVICSERSIRPFNINKWTIMPYFLDVRLYRLGQDVSNMPRPKNYEKICISGLP
jgi:hypothetical protein